VLLPIKYLLFKYDKFFRLKHWLQSTYTIKKQVQCETLNKKSGCFGFCISFESFMFQNYYEASKVLIWVQGFIMHLFFRL
jgi:hypothetical protein